MFVLNSLDIHTPSARDSTKFGANAMFKFGKKLWNNIGGSFCFVLQKILLEFQGLILYFILKL